MSEPAQEKIRSTLQGIREDAYVGPYGDHVLEIYKIYLEMTDRISGRRERANSFFLTLNTAVTALMGYVALEKGAAPGTPWALLVSLAGIVISYLWYRIIRSYKDLNSAKFLVVHEIERSLPLKPYDAEWEAVGRGKDPNRYLPFTHVEIAIPWVFVTLHVMTLLKLIPWSMFMQ